MQLAARIEEVHVCPMCNGPQPHVGGPVVSGSPDILTGEMPAARVTDLVTCAGPPDVILKGSATVLMNMLPAARLGDTTVHQGVISTGFPTVIIGDEGFGEAELAELEAMIDELFGNDKSSDSQQNEQGQQKPLQGQVEQSQQQQDPGLQSQEASTDTPPGSDGPAGEAAPLEGVANQDDFIATASDSTPPNPLAGLPDGTLLAMNPESGAGSPAGQNTAPQQAPLQGQVSLDDMTKLYPLPPAPKPPKPLEGKVTKQQEAKFKADKARYDKAKERYDKRVQPLKGRLQAVADLLNDPKLSKKYHLDTPKRKAAFLGQLGAETSGLQLMTEGENPWSGKNFINYETGSKGKELGNTEKGDGAKFRGRGPFQITGRGAYQNFADKSGQDVINHPELVAEDPNVGAESAANYWNEKTRPEVHYKDPKHKKGKYYKNIHLYEMADNGEITRLSKAINPAGLALGQRLTNTATALKMLSPPPSK